MTIRRRDFMKLLSATGMAVASPYYMTQRAYAAEPDRFWVFVAAGGAWDTTSLLDPKGNVDDTGKGNVNKYNRSDIKESGNFRYAPWMGEGDDPGTYDQFFQRYGSELVVVNGIDMETNAHPQGQVKIWSGDGTSNTPCIAALIAACNYPELPLSFISNGYFDGTSGAIPKTRVNRLDTIFDLALPNKQSRNSNNQYFANSVEQLIAESESDRLLELMGNTRLPEKQMQMNQLFTTRQTAGDIAQIVDKVPSEIERDGLRRQAQIACAAFAAGVASSANLTLGGFDTHDDNDARAYARIENLLSGVDFLIREAERQGVRDKLTVVIGSDFGRRPFYNKDNGKDHWPIGSMMVLGNGVNGNRTIGATTDGLEPRKLNRTTLEVANNGITLNYRDINRSLRQLAGIDNTVLAQQYSIGGRALNLFG